MKREHTLRFSDKLEPANLADLLNILEEITY